MSIRDIRLRELLEKTRADYDAARDRYVAEVEAELDAKDRRIAELEARQQELLATIVRVTNETPFPDEIKGWEFQRAKMLTEIGTLRSAVTDLRLQLSIATELNVNDRKQIAALEAELAKEAEATHQLAEEHEKQGMDLAFHRRGHNDALASITDLESQLAASRDIIRHFEQERDSWPAAYRQLLEKYNRLKALLPSEET